MDFSSLLNNTEKKDTLPIQKDADPAKYDAIAAKLCEKRYMYETDLNNGSLDEKAKEDTAFSLMQLRESMKTFGVTEVDYQAYLAYQEKHKAETDPTLF